MKIFHSIPIEFDFGAEGWREFVFNLELFLYSEINVFCPWDKQYFVQIEEYPSEGTDSQTGEVLAFGPEIIDIIDLYFDKDQFLTTYFDQRGTYS